MTENDKKKYDWIVTAGGSCDMTYPIYMHRVHTTTEGIKKVLVDMCQEDREDIGVFEEYMHGTESIKDVETSDLSNTFFAIVCFDTCHIDYRATRLDSIEIYKGTEER